MDSAPQAEGDKGDDDNDDGNRALRLALLDPPEGSHSHRCVLDRRALAHWVSQRGKVCAAAVVAGALNSIEGNSAGLVLEDVLQAFQSAWRFQIERLKAAAAAAAATGDGGQEALEAQLAKVTASYHKVGTWAALNGMSGI